MSDSTISDEIVYQLAIDGQAWFAATSLGLKMSQDQGMSWQSAYDSLRIDGMVLPTMALAAAQGAGGNLIFAGLNEALLRSTDGARSWQRLPLPSPAPLFSCLALSPDFAQDERLYAGTLGDGVLLYSQQGQNWANWNFGLLDLHVLCLVIAPAKSDAADCVIFAGGQSGAFRSLTGGRSWQELSLPCGFEPVISLALSPRFTEDGQLLAGTESRGLFCSSDRGTTWQPVGQFTDPLNALAYRTPDEIFALHGTNLVFSSDGGFSWQDWRPEALHGLKVSAFHLFPGREVLLVGLLGGEVRQIG